MECFCSCLACWWVLLRAKLQTRAWDWRPHPRAEEIDSKIKTSSWTNCGQANQVCYRSQKEKSIGKVVPKFSTNFPRLTGPFTSSIRDWPRIHDRCFRGLRHGWIALGHFGGWFKLTILRGRFRSDCLGSRVSDGLDTKSKRPSSRLGSP